MSTQFINFKFTCSKSYIDFPCCHRQWNHDGHCSYMHGYNRSFTFWFGARELDKNGFVVDFSSLKNLNKQLKYQFDHTFLVNSDDPLLPNWQSLSKQGALDLRVMKNVGMESSAELTWNWANSILLEKDKMRTCCWRVEARENESNAAYYINIPEWFEDN